MTNLVRRSGGGGTGSLIVATRSDNSNPAVFADFAALETYTATQSGTADAGRINVSNANNAREVFAVGTLNSSNQVTAITAAYIRLNDNWVAVATNLVGTPGTDGMDGTAGSALEFVSIAARDAFFANNAAMLNTGLPVSVNIGNNMVRTDVWNGPDTPTDYVVGDTRWRTASSMVSNNSLFLGSTQFSNSVEGISITDAFGNQFLAIGSGFDDSGTTGTAIFNLSAVETLIVNTENTTTISAPITVQYTTFGDNFTTDFDFIPASAGQLRAEFFIGADDSGTLIFDETRTVSQAEVDAGQFISFGVGNPYILDQGVQLFARFTGIDLRGGTVNNPGNQFDGQELIAFRSTIQPFSRRQLSFEDQLVDSVAATINGNDLTITVGRSDQPDLMTTVTLPATSGTTPTTPVSASITRFEIANQATSVLAGTTLSSTRTFNYNVNHPEDINGNLTLRQGSVILRDNINPSENTFDQAINEVTLNNNQQVVFTLQGETNEGILVSSRFTVRAHLPAEQLFYGQSTSNNPADVDTSTLTHTEAGIDNTVIQTGTTVDGNYFILLVPNDHDLVSIHDELGQNVTDIFTRTPDVRTLNGVLYSSYVFGPVNAGASESYTVRF